MIRLQINGQPFELQVPGQMPLLWVLRDQLHMTGTKFGCGKGLCGACTVHIDGQAARSCQLPVENLVGAAITTIEGLAKNGLDPLQKAWVENQVPQCGYCQSGQIMSAAALLRNNPQPSEGEVIEAMNGNLCRCGTYLRIRKAILQVANAR
jgi:isoquinoline 1-oxidoreductase subunit alpha